MFKRFPYLKQKLWAGELWSASYFARSVGEGVTGVLIKRYIEMHEERALGPTQAELFSEKTKKNQNFSSRPAPIGKIWMTKVADLTRAAR